MKKKHKALTPVEYTLTKGAQTHPWQMEVLEALANDCSKAILMCSGAGKTTVVAARTTPTQ